MLALSEVIGLLGKPYAPILPPWGTGIAAGAPAAGSGCASRRRCRSQLRFGRGVDNRIFKAAGFRYGYTSRETVIALAEHMRLHPLQRGAYEPYRYEREVEEFLRWSPHVRSASAAEDSGLTREQLARAAPAAARGRARQRRAGGGRRRRGPAGRSAHPSPPPRSTTTTTSSRRRSSRCSARSSPATWPRCGATRRITRRVRRCSARSTPFWPVCRQLLNRGRASRPSLEWSVAARRPH